MKPYKACWCRNASNGRLLGQKCPDLTKKTHGKWYARYEAPPDASGRRRRHRVGPCDTEREVKTALVEALGRVNSGQADDDLKTKFGSYLDRWLAWKKTELKPSTFDSYQEAVELYYRPALGHIRLADLRDRHFMELYTAMRTINRPAQDQDRSDLLRRLLAARARRNGHRISTRPLTEARIRRMHAVARTALNDAVPLTLTYNPAAAVKFGKAKARKVRPLLWTAPRAERWQQTGEVPASVMVWTGTQCGAFLDYVEATDWCLYALFHVDAYYGLRRGELIGLECPDLDLTTRRIHVRQSQADDALDSTKSEDSDRQITFDKDTAAVLRAWRERQKRDQVAWGEAWADSGRVFTREDGSSLRPGWVSERFGHFIAQYGRIRRTAAEKGYEAPRLARKYRVPEEAVRVALSGPPLPPIRFHDLRHGAATMLLAAGVQIKVISEILGHATSAFTADVYTEVAEELAEQAASAIAAFVPRRGQRGSSPAVRASNGPAKAPSKPRKQTGSLRYIHKLPVQEDISSGGSGI
jgi:integrase